MGGRKGRIEGSSRKRSRNKCIRFEAGRVRRAMGLFLAVTIFLLLLLLLPAGSELRAQLPWSSATRVDTHLDNDWKSVTDSTGSTAYQGFERPDYMDSAWNSVQVPHNWDDYGGYIRKKHGNLHGDAWYRKTFRVKARKDKASFLFFEGVGSYATVYLNGHKVGSHKGGRTGFTLEVSAWLKKDGSDNLLAVKVRHPAGIRDLPWVCGGCSQEVGFSEGSQPFGIFRPVHLIQTGKVRIQPFGVHIYNDTTITRRSATLYLETALENYGRQKTIRVQQQLFDRNAQQVAVTEQQVQLNKRASAGHALTTKATLSLKKQVHLWSLSSPYLYKLKTRILDAKTGKVLDELETPYGIRWIKWPDRTAAGPKTFLLNGQPVFINGIAGYEHAIGKSHAFTAQEIATRVDMIRSMGFNAFRDAHQPHNLRFQHYWDKDGVLWWPQFSAHIWFDTPAFRKNFLALLKDWVLARRNSPSNIMWGLQNESQLPADFAKKCVDLIRSLDPTASSQRLITTCNGGTGTDWDVPQNWSGTYGGDPDNYGEELKKEVLVGEYGGWRTKDLHTEGGFHEKGPYSEQSWCALLEKKIRWAHQVKDSVCGQFLWLFNSHDNPGRVQAAEGYRDLDRIGPVNYKGLLTSWEEPTEAVYLYQSNYTDPVKSPMVHIAQHDWPDRWQLGAGKKDIIVYSNCDSVILYNGNKNGRLGARTRAGIGTHFTWKNITPKYNVLYAVGYAGGKAVTHDKVLLRNLPKAQDLNTSKFEQNRNKQPSFLASRPGYQYLYRVNCGGPAYRDALGQNWSADRAETAGSFGSRSWTSAYPGLPSFFASQRRIYEPIKATADPALFQSFRYGRDQLVFNFPVPPGDYQVELYFAEPWWGIGNTLDCSGWRDFDVAINGQVKLAHLDIWKEAGSLHALKKTINVHVHNGQIQISFPHTYSGQAIISGIAIAKVKSTEKSGKKSDVKLRITSSATLFPAPEAKGYIESRSGSHQRLDFRLRDWLDTGDSLLLSKGGYTKKQGMTRGRSKSMTMHNSHITALPPALFGAQWLAFDRSALKSRRRNKKNDTIESSPAVQDNTWQVTQDLNMYVSVPKSKEVEAKLFAMGFTDTKSFIALYNERERGPATQSNLDRRSLSSVQSVVADVKGSSTDSLAVYVRQLDKGATFKAQSWWPSGLLAFKPLSHMQPPYDQKEDINFGVNKAVYTSGGKTAKRDEKDCIYFAAAANNEHTAAVKDSVSWSLVTGVAGFHSFQVRYANRHPDSVIATMKLLAADGKIMAEKAVVLSKTRPGKWNQLYLETPTMVNAGRYKLVLVWDRARTPLYIYSMKLK